MRKDISGSTCFFTSSFYFCSSVCDRRLLGVCFRLDSLKGWSLIILLYKLLMLLLSSTEVYSTICYCIFGSVALTRIESETF